MQYSNNPDEDSREIIKQEAPNEEELSEEIEKKRRAKKWVITIVILIVLLIVILYLGHVVREYLSSLWVSISIVDNDFPGPAF